MYKNAEGEWKTAAQLLPLWVHEAETLLAEAIEENRKNEVMKKR
jgi:hypothetical protein